MRLLAAALSGLLLAGCQTTMRQTVVGPVPLARGSAADFSPLVPPATGSAQCETRDAEAPGPRGRAISLIREEPSQQRITVWLDPEGAPFLYVDARGDLMSSDGRGGDRTTIGLYFTEGYAVAGNHPSGQGAHVLEMPLEEAAESENLGRPGEMLELVLRRCGRTD